MADNKTEDSNKIFQNHILKLKSHYMYSKIAIRAYDDTQKVPFPRRPLHSNLCYFKIIIIKLKSI